jgi:hypothetical protein
MSTMPGPDQPHVRIVGTSPADVQIEIDGHDIVPSGIVSAVSVALDADSRPAVAITLDVPSLVVDLTNPRIEFVRPIAKILRALGWVPPDQAALERAEIERRRAQTAEDARAVERLTDLLCEAATRIEGHCGEDHGTSTCLHDLAHDIRQELQR